MKGEAQAEVHIGNAYDKLAEHYDLGHADLRSEIYARLTLAGLDAILPDRPGMVLDAGAGTGKFAAHAIRRGHQVTLLDPSARMLDVARTRLEREGVLDRATFVEGSLEDLPFSDGLFDAVICEGDPLSYCIGKLDTAARELLRVLAPAGRFYVSCDNRWQASLAMFCAARLDEAQACADRGVSRDPYGLPVHAFSAGELAELFRRVGARDVTVTGKGVAINFLSNAQLESLVSRHGIDKVMAFEARFGAAETLAGVAGHLAATGRKGVQQSLSQQVVALAPTDAPAPEPTKTLIADGIEVIGSRNGNFVVDTRGGAVLELNETARMVLETAARCRTVDQVVFEMRRQFPEVAPHEIESDVRAVFAELERSGIKMLP